MSVDREYKIKISTASDRTGVDDASRGLDKVTEATKEATKHGNLLGNTHRDLHKLMHSLMETAPGLGIALRAVFSPVGAVIVSATAAFQHFKKELEEINKTLDELEEHTRKPIGNMKESLFEAAAAVADQRRQLEQWRDSMDDALRAQEAMFAHAITKLHEETAATKELITAREKAGLITAEAAEKQKQTADNTGMANEIHILQNQRGAQETNLFLLNRQEKEAEKQELDVKRRASEINLGKTDQSLKDEIDFLKSKKKDTLDAPTRKYEKEKKWVELFGGREEDQPAFSAVARARKDLDKAEEEAKQTDDQIARLEALRAQVQKEVGAVKDSEAAHEKLRQQITATNTALKATADRLQDLQTKAGIEKSTQAGIESVKRMSDSPIGGAAVKNVNEAQATADKFISGKAGVSGNKIFGATDAELRELVSVASTIAGTKVSLSQAIQMMEAAKNNHAIFVQDVTRLVVAMRGILTQLPRLRTDTDWVVQQVSLINSQMANRRNQ